MTHSGAGTRVLVIDDDDLVARMLASHVTAAGHEVMITTTAEAFLAAAATWRPTHVCVDLVMGDTDGIEVLRQLAVLGSDAAVIITSGMGDRVLDAARSFAAASGLAYGGVLHKPFSRQDVADVLVGRTHRAATHAAAPHELEAWSPEEFEEQLLAAVAGGDITVDYQPKVSCATRGVTGFEALARWHHPTLGAIPPMAFIPRVESLGLVVPLTDCVFGQSLAWFARAGATSARSLAVNISGAELTSRARGSQLRAACAVAGVEPNKVIFEVTETAAMADSATTLEVATRLRLAGFHLSIDDFGTGYAQMTRLSRLPFDELKIDGSFVQGSREYPSAELMVRTAVGLARGLRIVTTAEGVEDAETLALITELGCDFAQGFFIARPMDGESALAWLAERTSA